VLRETNWLYMRISRHEYRKANDREKGNEKRDKGNGTESQEGKQQRKERHKERENVEANNEKKKGIKPSKVREKMMNRQQTQEGAAVTLFCVRLY
jgi:hypothetical protein